MNHKKKRLHPVTDKQAKIIEFITAYRARHGVSPSIQNIADEFCVNVNCISDQLRSMEEKGAITRIKGVARSLLVVEVAA